MRTKPLARTLVAAGVALACAGTSLSAQASSHREAPFITRMPRVDSTDFYMFRSYEEGREDFVTLIANYNPLESPWAGPSYFALDPTAYYQIHIDNNGDALPDITFTFRFDNRLGNDGQGLAVPVGDETVTVPVKNIGPIGTGDNSGVLNFFQAYNVAVDREGEGDRGFAQPSPSTRAGGIGFVKPFDNVGQKSYGEPPGYTNYVVSVSNSDAIYNTATFEGCPSGAQQGRVFAGQRKEGFYVNLGETFDLVNIADQQGAPPILGQTVQADPGNNVIGNANIQTLALEVPIECLTAGGDDSGIIGGWQTAMLQRDRMLLDEPTFDEPIRTNGPFTQVSRLSAPLVNELFIGLDQKDLYNATRPRNDAQFATFVTNPTLPFLLNALFNPNNELGVDDIAPSNIPRNDLVAAFLTGIDGLNQPPNVQPAEMTRLNTAIPPAPASEQSPLGAAGGDLAGFPNGRRPGDDVVDIELRVAMGALCFPLPIDLDGSGTAGDAGDNLGLCQPSDAPIGDVPLTDAAQVDATDFDTTFPYLVSPIPGSPNEESLPFPRPGSGS